MQWRHDRSSPPPTYATRTVTFTVDDGESIDRAEHREALAAFYDATGGPNWNNRTNWKTDRPLNEWYGVTTRVVGQGPAWVTGLSLRNNNLTGEFPNDHLRQVATRLGALELRGNNLTGTIDERFRGFESTINPQRNGNYLPVGTPVPALPFIGALLLASGLLAIGRRALRQ